MVVPDGTVLQAGAVAQIHVRQEYLRANLKDGGDRPIITVKRRGQTYAAHTVEILGPSRMVTAGVLSCGARCWIETEAPIMIGMRGDVEQEDVA